MSSRSLLAALSSTGTGVTDRTTIRCPQCGQGRRKLGKCEGTMFLTDTGAFPFPPAPYRAISFRFGTRVNKILCDAQHWRRLYRASQTISTSLDFAWVHHYIPSDLGKHSGPMAGPLSTPASRSWETFGTHGRTAIDTGKAFAAISFLREESGVQSAFLRLPMASQVAALRRTLRVGVLRRCARRSCTRS